MQIKAVFSWMPGLKNLLSYKKEWLKYDIKAGLSVAAVALPVAIAYAELTGVTPIAGLYSTILPLIAYALFGTSRQLIIGPDTATCAVIAAVVTPLAAGDANNQWLLSIIMTFMVGVWCLIASRFRLGALADLLSRPILIGLLNGVSITIIVDQVAKACGFTSQSSQLIERIIQLPFNVLHSQPETVFISLFTLVIILLIKRFRSAWPAPLFAIIIATFISWLFDLNQYGVAVIGQIAQGGLPVANWHNFQPGLMRDLVIPALNIAVVSFVSMMLTARSFASKNGYEINVDAEFRALGIINIVSAFSQGFAVSGTSSRTAVNDANGGKTQLVSIIAAILIGLVLLFFLNPLQYIPVAVLGVVLITASGSLIDIRGILQFRHRNKHAYYLGLFTLVCVLLIGIIPGIGLAVLLGLLQFLRTVFRPTEQLLGLNDNGMIHTLGNSNDVKPLANVVMYRFNSPLTYFNIAYFKRRIINLVDGTLYGVRWVVIDAVACFTHADVSVLAGIEELKRDLRIRNIQLVLAGRKTDLTRWFNDNKPANVETDVLIVPDLYLAIKMIQSKESVETQSE